ncbi:hypothetical protein RQP46_000662 [Phenoliferia psychrophenolica]
MPFIWRAAVVLFLLASWTLSPQGSLLSLTVFLAATSLFLRLLVIQSKSAAKHLSILLGALVGGSTLSFALSHPGLATVLPPFESFLGLSLLSILFTIIPLLGILSGEAILQFASGPWRAVLVPAATFTVAGIVEERLGVGRTVWWVRDGVESEDWLVAYGGQPLLDFAVAGLAAVVADSTLRILGMVELTQSDTVNHQRISLIDEDDDDDREANLSTTPPRPSSRLRRALPFLPLITFLLPIFLGPLLPYPTFHRHHPAAESPTFEYPPVKVACVVPPALERHRGASHGLVEDWLQESRVVASRGAKVLSWSEGAVRLEADAGPIRGEGEGWDAMGKSEQEFLKKVAGVADQHKVYIAATYLLPASTPNPRFKAYNLVTLVGPSQSPTSPPNIIFSTTKHLPVPLIETYSHLSRPSAALLSAPSAFPVAMIPLPHQRSTPAPHTTPFQTFAISSQTCLDIALSLPPLPPTLSPALILNPSSTPLVSLAASQFTLAHLRAIEHHS